jgi:acyl carrier protein
MLENNRGEPVAHFEDSANLQTDLGLDSIDMVTLVIEIQDDLHIQLAMPELKDIQRVGQLLDLLQAKLAARQAA